MKFPNDRYSVGRMTLGIFCCAAVISTLLQALLGWNIPLNAYMSSTLVSTGVLLYLQEGQILYVIMTTVFALVALVPYLLCWHFSKKRRGWMIAAAVMLALETLLLLLDALTVLANGEFFHLFAFLCHVVLLVPVLLALRKNRPSKTTE
jgi:hypothetical protein